MKVIYPELGYSHTMKFFTGTMSHISNLPNPSCLWQLTLVNTDVFLVHDLNTFKITISSHYVALVYLLGWNQHAVKAPTLVAPLLYKVNGVES